MTGDVGLATDGLAVKAGASCPAKGAMLAWPVTILVLMEDCPKVLAAVHTGKKLVLLPVPPIKGAQVTFPLGSSAVTAFPDPHRWPG